MTIAHSNQISIPVAEPRRGPDSRRIVELFQPEQELLRASENNHQIDSVIHTHIVRQIATRIGRRLRMDLDTGFPDRVGTDSGA